MHAGTLGGRRGMHVIRRLVGSRGNSLPSAAYGSKAAHFLALSTGRIRVLAHLTLYTSIDGARSVASYSCPADRGQRQRVRFAQVRDGDTHFHRSERGSPDGASENEWQLSGGHRSLSHSLLPWCCEHEDGGHRIASADATGARAGCTCLTRCCVRWAPVLYSP